MSAFWDFSIRLYGQDCVKAACLDLQAAGLDVNVGLWVLWCCVNGRDPGPALGQAVALSAHWSDSVVKPVRSARDHLKTPPDFMDEAACLALRRQVLAVELEAERLQQHALEALAPACPENAAHTPRDLALARMHDYAARLGLSAAVAEPFVENVFEPIKNV